MTGGVVTSIRLTPEDRRLLERCVVESGMTRSCFFRRLLQDRANGMYGNVNHTISAAVLRSEIAGLANLRAPGGSYPAMTIRAYDLALVAARTSMDEILSGTLPMVGDDARTAGWDPYAEGTRWFYMRVLPKFFKTLLRLDRPPTVDVRYEPFEMVDGQHAGAIQGEVTSYRTTHPNGKTRAYTRTELLVGEATMVVMIPDADFSDITVGMSVRVAGTFRMYRRRMVVDARQCRVVR